jgi:hypothetical protein
MAAPAVKLYPCEAEAEHGQANRGLNLTYDE